MSKKQGEYENHRIEVTLDTRFEFKEPEHKDHVRRLTNLKNEIHRHCDDVDDAIVLFDATFVCEHCGAEWTEDDDDYNGGCCQ